MTKREAKRIGKAVAEEIDRYGDFTPAELSTAEAYAQAAFEIAENRKQYAGDVTEDFRREAEWEGYEEGLALGIADSARRRKLED